MSIFGLPQQVEGIGDVYPIKIKDQDEFNRYAYLLQITEKHFDEEIRKELSFFELVIAFMGEDEQLVINFMYLLKMTTKKDFVLSVTEKGEPIFVDDQGHYLSKENFNEYRDTVMKQNLVFEDRVFKDPRVKEWANKVLASRRKNSVDMDMEDKASVIHVMVGTPFEQIGEYTIYQFEEVFSRILKIEDYRKVIQFMCAGDDKSKLEPFMEKINLYKHPYDDVFKDKGQLNKLNDAIK
jgi:hypothetical protein